MMISFIGKDWFNETCPFEYLDCGQFDVAFNLCRTDSLINSIDGYPRPEI